MNETQDSESVNYDEQYPGYSKENDDNPGFEDKYSLRPESEESTDSDRGQKKAAVLKSSKLLSQTKGEQNTAPRKGAQLIMNISGNIPFANCLS